MKHIKRKLLLGITAVFVGMLAWYWITSDDLTVTHYTVEAELEQPVRIVQLTDLHNASFGESNCELIDLVLEQSPDLIVMTGDMLNRDDEDLQIVTDLIKALCGTAPVYYGFGNHESVWEENWGRDLHEELSAAGAVVLDNEHTDITVNGWEIRIGGYMGYYWQPHMMTADPAQQRLERAFYEDFEHTPRFRILLNHIPTQWLDWEYINRCPVDFIFSGHYHGGVIRIPIWDRGVVAPYVGWFPPYTKGIYTGTEGTCVLSAGLGSEYPIPRLNNPPEIIVTDFVPA